MGEFLVTYVKSDDYGNVTAKRLLRVKANNLSAARYGAETFRADGEAAESLVDLGDLVEYLITRAGKQGVYGKPAACVDAHGIGGHEMYLGSEEEVGAVEVGHVYEISDDGQAVREVEE